MVRPTPAQVRFVVQPRLVPPIKAARRLHLTLADFTAKLPALLRSGFPNACSITGHYDLVAIDEWLDQRRGAGAKSDALADEEYIRARIAEIGQG